MAISSSCRLISETTCRKRCTSTASTPSALFVIVTPRPRCWTACRCLSCSRAKPNSRKESAAMRKPFAVDAATAFDYVGQTVLIETQW
ncbi:hypothetical protein FK515_29615, partial [Klebsiella pneumoniae]|nr:hypothetical protein [Klebsiella pneumoniae]